MLTASAASAKQADNEIDYDAHGGTTLSNVHSHAKVTFKPTVLKTFITPASNGNLDFTADLPLAPVTAGFKADGRKPAKGVVVFTQVQPITGEIDINGNTGNGYPVTGAAEYVVSLRDVVIDGRNAHVGTNCQTIEPVMVAVQAEPGFDLVTGTLKGSYDLGHFQDCGDHQHFVNKTLPGRKNSLTLHIKGRTGS
ncbi:hypothetical protein [Jatrophihabitans endophyticus]|uniref:hypothetical protein n=1 Tax=Jatrophihabitans endophyticus TaxID=1206085 RepID=UPI001A0C0B74|nr:hypothetical protein [Jatrophihabitans endophyticus]MBE7188735.1 hypothetical protein [Jatrophihabitans endophyticus]